MQGSPRPHGLDTGKFERTSLFYRPSHRPEMFLVTHLDGDRSPLNPYEWLDSCPREVWMDNIHVEVIERRHVAGHRSIASQADLSEWRWPCAIRSEQMARDGSATRRAPQVLVSRQVPL